ncbi:MAG: polysaccharide biosynthesis protein [Cyclobacteriaceae bacterium]
MLNLSEKNILLTGGTGSFGQTFTKSILHLFPEIRSLKIFSRDEFKQYEMRRQLSVQQAAVANFVLGDIRDQDALEEACTGVDYVIHSAALKQNDMGERNPDEFVRTNVDGTRNLIRAAKARGVAKVLALSTDKAVYPVSAYGASKLCAEKLLLAEAKKDSQTTLFSVLRLGNLLGSRASVVPALAEKEGKDTVSITHPEMSRFSLSLQESVQYCLQVLELMQGGEVFVPAMAAYRLKDLVKAILPHAEIKTSGPRVAEKMHELALSPEESRFGFDAHGLFVLCSGQGPAMAYWQKQANPLPENFVYSSEFPRHHLTVRELRDLLQNII